MKVMLKNSTEKYIYICIYSTAVMIQIIVKM